MGVEGGRGDGGCEEMMTRAVWLKRRCNRGGGARGVAGQQSKGPHHQHDHSADSSGVTELERGPVAVGREGGGERAAAAVQAHRIDPRCKACLPGFSLLSTGGRASGAARREEHGRIYEQQRQQRQRRINTAVRAAVKTSPRARRGGSAPSDRAS